MNPTEPDVLPKGTVVRHVQNSKCGLGTIVKYEESYGRYRIMWEHPECMSNSTHSREQLIVEPTMTTPTKLNPLHNPDMLANHMLNTGEYFPIERRTGRSTIQALGYIAEAMRKPHTVITIRDHHGTTLADQHLTNLTRELANRAGLDHFYFGNCTICFGQRSTPNFFC